MKNDCLEILIILVFVLIGFYNFALSLSLFVTILGFLLMVKARFENKDSKCVAYGIIFILALITTASILIKNIL